MIEDLMKLKKQIDTMVQTYRDLHPIEYEEHVNGFIRGVDELHPNE